MMIESIGWIGSTLLGICGIPQAYHSIKKGNSTGISSLFLWFWGLGEVFTLIYVISRVDIPLIFNYTFNLLIIAPIVWYKLYPRKL